MIGFLEGPIVERYPTRAEIEGLRAWREEHHKSRCILVFPTPWARRSEHGI